MSAPPGYEARIRGSYPALVHFIEVVSHTRLVSRLVSSTCAFFERSVGGSQRGNRSVDGRMMGDDGR